ncbi:MAG: hypothetical protein ABSC42_09040 [Tepidisphaeraceae bacterium]
MKRHCFFPAMVLIGLMGVGCASKQTFDVTVTNRLGDPITVWMTKAKPQAAGNYEEGWMPPEVLAVGTTQSQRLGGVAIEPGETGHTVLKGTIANDDVAVLRVYRAVDLNVILTLHYGNPDRLDIPLDQGVTDIDVVKQKGQMTEIPHGAKTMP